MLCQVHRSEDNGCLLIARMLTDARRQFKAIDLGHAYVHQDNGNIGFEQVLQGFPS